MENKRNIPIIEWEDLDKRKFYLFGLLMTMVIRLSIYPFTLIRTRLQVQKGKSLYSGTFDAFGKILRSEGPAGLYRGFLVNTFTLISGQCYVTTYELTRKYMARYHSSNAVKSVIAGGSASLVAQSITVPIDVVSQHLMVRGQALGRLGERPVVPGSGPAARRLFVGHTKEVMAQIFRLDGLRGFYRGYAASLMTYIPNSALWWPFYHLYTGARSMENKRNIPIIEWEDLDKRKFYLFGLLMTMVIRLSIYPFTLIRTRLQVQKGKSLYSGTFDAFGKILRSEGPAGLYRGFLVNTFTLISGQCYVTTYELTRKYMARYHSSNAVKSVIAGGSASLVAQSITVPIDVVSQHLMVRGQALGRLGERPVVPGSGPAARRLFVGHTKEVMAQIFRLDGLRGFYRGYAASLMTYIPNSALWWPFYHLYTEQLSHVTPTVCPHLVVQAVAGPLAAATSSTLTNPMDIIRARVQVEGRHSMVQTFKQLMAEEGAWGLTKGLSARILSSTPSAVCIVVGYETLKKLSLRPELVDSRHW